MASERPPKRCVVCGRVKSDSRHVRYGNDLDNPVKHEFIETGIGYAEAAEWRDYAIELEKRAAALCDAWDDIEQNQPQEPSPLWATFHLARRALREFLPKEAK